MGKAGRERVSQEYSWSQKGERLSALYGEVTGLMGQ
jgi:glycosyltransferase involved in cell wall biosynthesis